jgi:uncharacterized membrane protein YccC
MTQKKKNTPILTSPTESYFINRRKRQKFYRSNRPWHIALAITFIFIIATVYGYHYHATNSYWVKNEGYHTPFPVSWLQLLLTIGLIAAFFLILTPPIACLFQKVSPLSPDEETEAHDKYTEALNTFNAARELERIDAEKKRAEEAEVLNKLRIEAELRETALQAESRFRDEDENRRRIRAEEEAIRRKREAEEAAERAFWASPEGQKVKAAQMLAEIRLAEQAEALKMAKEVAEHEEARKEREFNRLKEL